jgi:hypothetical protein
MPRNLLPPQKSEGSAEEKKLNNKERTISPNEKHRPVFPVAASNTLVLFPCFCDGQSATLLSHPLRYLPLTCGKQTNENAKLESNFKVTQTTQ